MNLDENMIFCILGMHRSGTSVTAGVLQDYGVYAPGASKDDPYNKKGNQENTDIRNLHNKILNQSGWIFNYNWKNPPNKIKIKAEDIRKRDLLLNQFQNNKYTLFKDPRTLYTLDLWEGVQLYYIGVYRNPISVANSLIRRDPNMSMHEAIKIWTRYNNVLLRLRKDRRFPIVNFDNKMALINNLKSSLGFYDYKVPENTKSSFYESRIEISHTTSWYCNENITKRIISIWKELSFYSFNWKILI